MRPTVAQMTHTKWQNHKKKYVIEVQDHQQAMRYANPLVDLEDTVRKGINNPLSDPRFIMSSITSEIPTQNQNNLFNNREFLSYHTPANPSPDGLLQNVGQSNILSVNTNNLSNRLSVNMPSQEQATKEQIVARHPPSVPMMSDMYNPPFHPFHSSPLIQANEKNHLMNLLSGISSTELSANLGQDIAGGLSAGLPGGVAAFSRGKLSPLSQGLELGKLQQAKQQQMLQQLRLRELKKQLLQRRESNNKILQQNLVKNQLLNRQINRQKLLQTELLKRKLKLLNARKKTNAENINPLTGLPDDLEQRSYGSVSSITSVSEAANIANPVTEDNGDTSHHTTVDNSASSLTSSLPSLHSQHLQNEKPVKESVTSPLTSQTTSSTAANDNNNSPIEMEQSFPSLKSFLEADNILREKLNKEALSAPSDLSDPDKALGQGSVNLGPGFDVSVGETGGKSDDTADNLMTAKRAISSHKTSTARDHKKVIKD